VLTSRLRAVMLSLLAVMLVGSVMAATAYAEPEAGPFWYHRSNSEEEKKKIEPKAPENFSGEGGEQIFIGKVGGTEFEIGSEGTQVKGAIFNGAHSGQVKFEIVYKQPKLKRPALSGCTVKVGTNNIVVIKGHLAWKWNGTPAQLGIFPQLTEQIPDIVFTNVEPQEQKPFVSSDYRKVGVFTNITFSSNCAGLAGTFGVAGSEVGIPNLKAEEWSRELAVRTLSGGTLPKEIGEKEAVEGEGFLQHIWEGTRFQGIIVGLMFSGNPADLIGQNRVRSAQQEISVFEK
jgi:hypothetical protein